MLKQDPHTQASTTLAQEILVSAERPFDCRCWMEANGAFRSPSTTKTSA